ncbi:hypothetical protein EPH_0074550 [Eimeria praecox]|uniref:Uncharacterized protein n=1 Tax=Eimeria praecox TaxID=51316 RepID=U6H808_9EIME|nr:hypothetical protein EPH_0074550 [Eimeria praecox]
MNPVWGGEGAILIYKTPMIDGSMTRMKKHLMNLEEKKDIRRPDSNSHSSNNNNSSNSSSNNNSNKKLLRKKLSNSYSPQLLYGSQKAMKAKNLKKMCLHPDPPARIGKDDPDPGIDVPDPGIDDPDPGIDDPDPEKEDTGTPDREKEIADARVLTSGQEDKTQDKTQTSTWKDIETARQKCAFQNVHAFYACIQHACRHVGTL